MSGTETAQLDERTLQPADLGVPMPFSTRSTFVPLAVIAGAALSCATASAGVLSFSGALTVASPTFVRPAPNGALAPIAVSSGDVYYFVQPFYVSATGAYDIEVVAATIADPLLGLYATSFNPTAPLVNALVYDDDSGGSLRPRIRNWTLTAGTQYFGVVTAFTLGQSGTFDAEVRSDPFGAPAIITAGSLPTGSAPAPGVLALLGLGGLGLFAATRARHRA